MPSSIVPLKRAMLRYGVYTLDHINVSIWNTILLKHAYMKHTYTHTLFRFLFSFFGCLSPTTNKFDSFFFLFQTAYISNSLLLSGNLRCCISIFDFWKLGYFRCFVTVHCDGYRLVRFHFVSFISCH